MWPFKKKKEDEDTVFYTSESARKQAEAEKQLIENKNAIQRGRKMAIAKDKLKGTPEIVRSGYTRTRFFLGKYIALIVGAIFVIIGVFSKKYFSFFPDPWSSVIASGFILVGIIAIIKISLRGKLGTGVSAIAVIIFLFLVIMPMFSAQTEPIIKQFKTQLGMMKCVIITFGQDPSCWETQEQEVEKVGTYDSLTIVMGKAKVGNKYIPSSPPRAGKTYILDITLENNNIQGSGFDINVTTLNVSAEPSGNTETENIVYAKVDLPRYKIQPQHYYRVKAEFDENNKLPSDAKYIHFFGTVTSQQKGGGTSKIKLVPQYSGYEKSIELFDPDIKTNPGPIDVYVYTNPSVIEVDQMKNFDVVINFYNGGKDGTASIKNVILYQTFANLDELPFEINCEETKGTAEPVECPDNKKGNCWQITFNEDSQLNIPPKESRQIYCDAIVNNEFALIHELTVPISVVSEYTYIQEFGTTRKVQSS